MGNHKVIGKRYFYLSLIAAITAVLMSLLMRARLAEPLHRYDWLEKIFPAGFNDGIMTPDFYLALTTMHGTIMVFIVLITCLLFSFGCYFIPSEIGCDEHAFPLINTISFYLVLLSFLLLIAAMFVEGGGPIGGWTFYPPLSAFRSAGGGQGTGADIWLAAIAIFCIASFLTSINFIITILFKRKAGLSLMQLPMPCWGWLLSSFVSLLIFPVLLTAVGILFSDRNFGTGFFNPGGLFIGGSLESSIPGMSGSPLLWQHLFWFFGHPAVYLVILPAMGIVSQILSIYSGNRIYGYKAMVYSMSAIAILGFLIWGHHMFVSGMDPRLVMAFSATTIVVGVPSAVKTFNWIGTLWGGEFKFTTAMLFALGFVSFFISGGVTGLVLAQTPLDMVFHDTYFVTGHFHLIMGVAAVFAIFAFVYHHSSSLFYRSMNERLGKWHFVLTFVGAYAIFIPFHILGIAGHPRRYADTLKYDFLRQFDSLHGIITIAAIITAIAQLIFFYNLLLTKRRGSEAHS